MLLRSRPLKPKLPLLSQLATLKLMPLKLKLLRLKKLRPLQRG